MPPRQARQCRGPDVLVFLEAAPVPCSWSGQSFTQPCFLRVLLAGLPTCPLGHSLLSWPQCSRPSSISYCGCAHVTDGTRPMGCRCAPCRPGPGRTWWFLNPGVFLSLLLRYGQLRVSGCWQEDVGTKVLRPGLGKGVRFLTASTWWDTGLIYQVVWLNTDSVWSAPPWAHSATASRFWVT